ncbi:hypothetical protein PGT21_013409 [Puccinia graminis f. sp. tritici]|uniref:Uncharacterized protein n=1 Tax=Puccinia graminis f. sp. tritici TaxID=56615 RepID=A0A5B0P8R2_PUCGR|nr:hypothetical protein PGT21_013409 [Puccinia graminis f. sp. tritici]
MSVIKTKLSSLLVPGTVLYIPFPFAYPNRLAIGLPISLPFKNLLVRLSTNAHVGVTVFYATS